LSDPANVPLRLAAELGLNEQASGSPLEIITIMLARCQMLIVFDNCEHALTACAALARDLLQKCPRVKILATSLQALGLPQETVWVVPPLGLPVSESGRDALGGVDAERLFVERAEQASPAFSLNSQNAAIVAAICRRLDGIPLAIELAACFRKQGKCRLAAQCCSELSALGDIADLAVHAAAHSGRLAELQGDYAHAKTLHEGARTGFQRLGDRSK
jgi:predicted ATPase